MSTLINRDEHAWHDVTRFEDLPNRVEICICCGGVLVTAPSCATPEQVAAAEAHARRLSPAALAAVPGKPQPTEEER